MGAALLWVTMHRRLSETFRKTILYISPNPAADQLTINGYLFLRHSVVSVFNVLGEIIQEERIESSGNTSSNGKEHATTNIRNLSAGIYFIRVTNENVSWVGRFVKE